MDRDKERGAGVVNVTELIDELAKQDPKAPVYLYDPDWDSINDVQDVTTHDPRAVKREKLHKNSVWIMS